MGNSPIHASELACGASIVPTVRPPRSDAGNSYQPFEIMQLANVPKELRDGKRFVCWREEIRNGKPTKVPVNPHTGNADAPARPGGLDYACAAGTWVRIYIPRARTLPAWAHVKTIRRDACGRGDGPGIVVWATGADQSVLICANGQINPS